MSYIIQYAVTWTHATRSNQVTCWTRNIFLFSPTAFRLPICKRSQWKYKPFLVSVLVAALLRWPINRIWNVLRWPRQLSRQIYFYVIYLRKILIYFWRRSLAEFTEKVVQIDALSDTDLLGNWNTCMRVSKSRTTHALTRAIKVFFCLSKTALQRSLHWQQVDGRSCEIFYSKLFR